VSVNVEEIIVRKAIVIHAPVQHVFEIFTTKHNLWWPRSHHIGKSETFTAVLEPHVGGRWFERAPDGIECNWGRVLVWEPPHRLILTWDISKDWTYDQNLATVVEVRFIAESDSKTRVELEHSKIECYGDYVEMMRGIFDSPQGWSGVLSNLAKSAEA
jgi:uncharacterized protein YndB with AHSA1/START domain